VFTTARTAIEARVLVTERVSPLMVGNKPLHQMGRPYHWDPTGSPPATRLTSCCPRRARPERAHSRHEVHALRRAAEAHVGVTRSVVASAACRLDLG